MNIINLGAVLSEINKPNSVFDLTYRKEDGSWGEKKGCMARRSDNALNERKKMNRSGKLKLMLKNGHRFELWIDLLETFNGIKINHFQ